MMIKAHQTLHHSRSFINRICNGGRPCHCLLIAAVAIILYANTLTVPFLFDDLPYIVNNKAIGTYFDTSVPKSVENAGLLPDIINNMDIRRVAYFTFALNHLVNGHEVIGYHIVNLLIHLATALTVYALIAALLQTPIFSDYPSRRSLHSFFPLIIALLFVCHPVQTSAVTYIIQRFTTMATFFYLLSVTLYVRARMSDRTVVQVSLLTASVCSAVLGMFTKEIVFTLPIIALLCEVVFLKGKWSRRFLFLLPLFCTMLIIPVNMLSQIDTTGSVKDVFDDSVNMANLDKFSQKSYFFTQLRVMMTYFRLLLLPINQHLDYDYPMYHSLFDPPVATSALFLVAIIISAVWAFRKSHTASSTALPLRLYFFGVAWFFITISMSSSIFPLSDMIFEYRLYLPSIGFFIALLSLGVLARQRFERTTFPVNKVFPVFISLVLAALCLATISRNHVWRDPIRFWEDNVAKAPMKKRPHNHLAIWYRAAGKLDENINQKLIMINLSPNNPNNFKNWNDIAVNLTKLERYSEALAAIKKAISLQPGDQRLYMTYDWVRSFMVPEVDASQQKH